MAEKMTDKQKIKILKEKLANATKRSGMGAMGVYGLAPEKLKDLMLKKPRKLGTPDSRRAPMQKGPNKMNKQKTPMKKALGPVRPIRERSLSKLTLRRRATK